MASCNVNSSNLTSKLNLLATLPNTRTDCPREKKFVRKRDKAKLIEIRKTGREKHMQDVKQRKEDHEQFLEEECLVNLLRRPPQERQVRSAFVHSPEHFATIKQRRLQLEKVRNQQVLEDLSMKEKKKRPLKSLKPATQNKQKEAEQRRLDLAQMRQAEVKNELKNKEMRAKSRKKEQENIQKLKCKNLMEKNKLLHLQNKINRVAEEEQVTKMNEHDLELKEIRTNKNLGIEVIPPKQRKKYFFEPKEKPIADYNKLKHLFLETGIDYDALLEDMNDAFGFDGEESMQKEQCSNEKDVDLNQKAMYDFKPLAMILNDINIDSSTDDINKRIHLYSGQLCELNKKITRTDDKAVDWSKWEDEFGSRVRAMPEWQVHAMQRRICLNKKND